MPPTDHRVGIVKFLTLSSVVERPASITSIPAAQHQPFATQRFDPFQLGTQVSRFLQRCCS
jgi:hypothetical protein